jgi:hypothetical protein
LGTYLLFGTRIHYAVSFNNEVKCSEQGVFQNADIARIDLPDSVARVGYGFFRDCKSLASINKNDNTMLSDHTFIYSITLKEIHLGNGNTSIGKSCFESNGSLTKVYIPNTVQNIKERAFYNCTAMRCYDFSHFTAVPTLENIDAFTGIPSNCKIYVPADLLDEWKADSNWAAYAEQITIMPGEIFGVWEILYQDDNFGECQVSFVYNGKTYNCFPIMKISEDLSKVEEIAMFGCEGGRENTCYDDYLDMPVDYEIWSNLKPFRELMENN